MFNVTSNQDSTNQFSLSRRVIPSAIPLGKITMLAGSKHGPRLHRRDTKMQAATALDAEVPSTPQTTPRLIQQVCETVDLILQSIDLSLSVIEEHSPCWPSTGGYIGINHSAKLCALLPRQAPEGGQVVRAAGRK